MNKLSELLRTGEKLAQEQGIKHGKHVVYRMVDDHVGEVCALGMIALADVNGDAEQLPNLGYAQLWDRIGGDEVPNTCLLAELAGYNLDSDATTTSVSIAITDLNDDAELTASQIADILEKCGY